MANKLIRKNRVVCPRCDKEVGIQGFRNHLQWQHGIAPKTNEKGEILGYYSVRGNPVGRPKGSVNKAKPKLTVEEPKKGAWVATYTEEPPIPESPLVKATKIVEERISKPLPPPSLAEKMNAAKEVFPGDSYLQTAYLLMREPLNAGNLRTAARCLDARANEIEEE